MACRIYLSSSVPSCKRDFEEPGGDRHKPELYEFPLNAGRMLNEGFVSCLKQLGLKSVELPLEQGYASLVSLDQDLHVLDRVGISYIRNHERSDPRSGP